MSDLDNEASFQTELYKKMNPKTANDIIAVTHHPNHSMHKIITLLNHLPIHILIRNEIDKDIMMFEDTFGGCESLLSYPLPFLYSTPVVLPVS